jgi:glycosyltransferase involved in cell wall biosynthesis
MSNASQPMTTHLDRVAILIPSRRPGPELLPLLLALRAHDFAALIVVDDGSGSEFAEQFSHISSLSKVHLLRHAVNLGKGRALKTGFNYVLDALPNVQAVVTADSDGQHTSTDIHAVASAVAQQLKSSSPLVAVLGMRVFAKDVPARSKLGNLITRQIFRFLTGVKVSDTQTGLRAVPRSLLPELMLLDGERYEYEMTMLAHLCRSGRNPVEVPIETVYIDGNRSSHFDPIRDSMRIYFVLLRFYFSSLVAAGIDFAGFSIAFATTHNLWLSIVVGRLSSVVNFALNRRLVFRNRSSVSGALWRYYVLAAVIAGASYGLVWSTIEYLHWNVFAAKITADVLLSLVSFSAQQTFVFRRSQESE